MNAASWPPCLAWARNYDRERFGGDALAALIVTVMLVPQSLAYAMLAGLPAEVGLYASIAPLLAYTLLGTSTSLAVGPVAVLSLMTGATIASVAPSLGADPVVVAITLAGLSGLILVLMGITRLGFVTHFLSHSVIAGFITASGLLIAAGQLRHLLGIPGGGHNLPEILAALRADAADTHLPTLVVGLAVLGFLFWARGSLRGLLLRLGMPAQPAAMLARAAPAIAVLATLLISHLAGLAGRGVAVVGQVPAGLPGLALPVPDIALLQALAVPALMLAIIGYVESISVAQTFAARRREHVDPNAELVALGGANIASAVSGGMPVTGGFSRSAVNFDAGARTPLAGGFCALGIGVLTMFLGPYLADLPRATLAATIIVAVLGVIDLRALVDAWRFARSDFFAAMVTIALTLLVGVETGIAAGVAVSIALHLYRTSRPHVAVVGRVPGTEHFRNVLRHAVETRPGLLCARIDESLYFANAHFLEQWVLAELARRPEIRDFVLQCSAVNDIDASALHSLRMVNEHLRDAGVRFHLSEVKGPVMDRLRRSPFLGEITGRVFLSQYEAWCELGAGPAPGVMSRPSTA